MIAPSPITLRRRSAELKNSGTRETEATDFDSAALMKFYAAECGLKSIYMARNGLKHTDEARGGKSQARSFGHHLQSLVEELNISPREVPKPPRMLAKRTNNIIQHHQTHECWRYGEKLVDTKAFSDWLDVVIAWVEKQI